MISTVALTAFAAALSVVVLLACMILAIIFYMLRRKRNAKCAVKKPLLNTTPLPMSSGILKLKTDYGDRFYSDSEDSGAITSRWSGHHTDDSLADDLSDYEYAGHRRNSQSAYSNSSNDNWLLSSFEDTASDVRTPGSSASNSPNISTRICFLNLSLQYNFHQDCLDILLINITSPPKQRNSSKGIFIITQLFMNKENGVVEEFNSLHKTEMKSYHTNVSFNEEFKYEGIPSDELQAISMRLSLCSHDRFSRVQSIGEFIVNLNEVKFDPVQPLLLQCRLTQTNSHVASEEKGELSLSLRYQRGSKKISVIVLKATNLRKPKKFMTNEPYITIKLLYKDEVILKKKTKSKKGTTSPCWNEPFAFDLDKEDLTKYMLIFTIKAKDIFSSAAKLGMVSIGAHAKSTGRDHWNESVCSKNNTMRQVTMTHKLS